jgi:hypothetical protein
VSWRGLLLVGAGWVVFCAAVAVDGPIVGAIVGAASVAIVAGARLLLELDERRAELAVKTHAGRRG